MPDCDYCSAAFDDEDTYLEHLRDEHDGELGRIDQRRVQKLNSGGMDLPTEPLILGSILVLAVVVLIAAVVILGGDSGAADGEPHSVGSVHEHGTMEVIIDGEELDFHSDEFIRDLEYPEFHFHHGYDGYENYIIHIHAQGVTLQWALDTLDIEVNDEGTTLTYDGVTYDADAGDEIRIEVNGESVEPGSHVLRGVGPVDQADAGLGDDVVVVVESAD